MLYLCHVILLPDMTSVKRLFKDSFQIQPEEVGEAGEPGIRHYVHH